MTYNIGDKLVFIGAEWIEDLVNTACEVIETNVHTIYGYTGCIKISLINPKINGGNLMPGDLFTLSENGFRLLYRRPEYLKY